MWERENARQHARKMGIAGPATVKYDGKWPFRRVLGMQEVASVLFSLCNLAAQAHCLVRLTALLRQLAARTAPKEHIRSTVLDGEDETAADGASRAQNSPGWEQRGISGLRGRGFRHSRAVDDGSRHDNSSIDTVDKRLRLRKGSLQQLTAVYPWWPLWAVYFGISLSAWAASAAFHARDINVTEAADYMLADAVVLWGTLTTALRVLGLRQPRQWAPLLLVGAAAYGLHWHRMLTVLFDYGFNVALCVSLGILQSLMWAVWVGRTKHPVRYRMWTFLALLNVATAFEVFDFPPVAGLLDAHALWHAATVPLAYLFSSFIAGDAVWSAGRAAVTPENHSAVC